MTGSLLAWVEHDSQRDVAALLSNLRHRVDELQLRGKDSAPPSADAPIREWLASLRRIPEVLCVEHREPITLEGLAALVSRIRGE